MKRARPTRDDVAKAALALVGTPYHLRGRVSGVALDCLGVVVCAHRNAGIPIEETPDYRAAARMGLSDLRFLAREFVPVRPNKRRKTISLRPGDVVFWKLGAQGHLGIVAEDEDGDLVVVEADDRDAFMAVAIVPMRPVDRAYRHRALTRVRRARS